MTATDTYTLPQHERKHWQGNRPVDCRRCHPRPAPDAWRDHRDDGDAFTGLLVGIPFSLTILAALAALLSFAVTGVPFNGFTAATAVGLVVTLSVGAVALRADR